MQKKQKNSPKPPFSTENEHSFLDAFFPDTEIIQRTETPKKFANGAASQNEKKQNVECDTAFLEFWGRYPYKEKRKASYAFYRKNYKKHRQIIIALEKYMSLKEDWRRWMMPITFLNNYEEYLSSEIVDSGQLPQKFANGAAEENSDSEFEQAMQLFSFVKSKVSGIYAGANTAFEFKDNAGNRVFTDRQAAWIDSMGGMNTALTEFDHMSFDRMALTAWRTSSKGVA